MPADIELRELFGRLKSRIDRGEIGGGGGGNGIAGSARVFANVPEMMASTDEFGIALCQNYYPLDGTVSFWVAMTIDGNLVRLPNGTSILATAGGQWMWLVAREPFSGTEVITPSPEVVTINAAVHIDFPTIADAQGANINAYGVTVYSDAAQEFAQFRRVDAPDITGTEGRDWFVNVAGVYYRRV